MRARMQMPMPMTSLAGPGAFAAAAFVGGRMVEGYTPRDEPISALAAQGVRAAPVQPRGAGPRSA